MQPFGPVTLTAGVISRVDVGNSVDRVYIGNDSPYDVLISFASYTPPVVTAATSPWIAWVQSKQGWTLPVASDPDGFNGSVWLLPINTRNPTQALNGTTPTTSNAIIQALYPGEPEPPSAAYQDQVTIASQTRAITIPPTPLVCISGDLTVNSGAFGTLPGALNISSLVAVGAKITCYLNYFIATPGTSTAWGKYALYFSLQNNGGTTISRAEVARFTVVGNAQTTGSMFAAVHFFPPFPPHMVLTRDASTTTTLVMEGQLLGTSGAADSMVYTIGYSVDTTNNGSYAPSYGSARFITDPTVVF